MGIIGSAFLGYKRVFGAGGDNIPTSGGSIVYDGDYIVQTFTSTDTLSVSANITNVDILLIAGGGAGGAGTTISGCGTRVGGGGGAGGMIYITGSSITSGSYPVTIGNGGIADTTSNPSAIPEKGGDSIFDIYTAFGGGGGGRRGVPERSASDGGSGGGGVFMETGTSYLGLGANALQTGSNGFGNDGADSYGSMVCGPYTLTSTSGGGGGAGGGTTTEVGGAGKTISITGTAIEYAKGGYGGNTTQTTTARSYGDGGHGFFFPNERDGDGGDGILILRYPLTQ